MNGTLIFIGALIIIGLGWWSYFKRGRASSGLEGRGAAGGSGSRREYDEDR